MSWMPTKVSSCVVHDLLLWHSDELGFLSINENLQAAGGPPNIFAVGDVATSTVYPRPKAGVFAVRQGPPLTDNIRRYTFKDSLFYASNLRWFIYCSSACTDASLQIILFVAIDEQANLRLQMPVV